MFENLAHGYRRMNSEFTKLSDGIYYDRFSNCRFKFDFKDRVWLKKAPSGLTIIQNFKTRISVTGRL